MFREAAWTDFTAGCEAAAEELETTLDDLSVETLCEKINDFIITESQRHIPRGARADPKHWAADPELDRAVTERREARASLRWDYSAEARDRWKRAKKEVAEK